MLGSPQACLPHSQGLWLQPPHSPPQDASEPKSPRAQSPWLRKGQPHECRRGRGAGRMGAQGQERLPISLFCPIKASGSA